MEPTSVFSRKAKKYARYRWDYAPQAFQSLFGVTQISHQSSVADIGAGTGMLTKHFIGRVKQVWAVEPNAEMRKIAIEVLGSHPSCHISAGRAEATTLPDISVDLISVGQAFNWFDPVPTRSEFVRILKPGGWLAGVRNYGTNRELGEALEKIYPQETDTLELMKGRGTPLSFYYGGEDYLKQTFPFAVEETWEVFMGALASASYAPDEGNPLYPKFERAAREIFNRFSTGGLLVSQVVTEVCLGHIKELAKLQV